MVVRLYGFFVKKKKKGHHLLTIGPIYQQTYCLQGFPLDFRKLSFIFATDN